MPRAHVRNLSSISDPLEAKSAEFDNKLRLLVLEIKEKADGKTCGSCTHYRGAWCAQVVDHDGEELLITYPGAVACREWASLSLSSCQT